MKNIGIAIIGFGLWFATNAFAGSYIHGKPSAQYEVTITNITHGQTFTPILAATHKKSIQFFTAGEPASAELATLAESGNVGPLNDLLITVPNLVLSTVSTEGLLEPGRSVQFTIGASRKFNRLSFAAMLIPTNDTFVALDTVSLPRYGSRTYFVSAYDAGSEPNDELCANIPGPACGGVGPSPEAGGEGYVHISPGIHGEADLAASKYDWRNPVAKVVVRRVYY